MNLILLAFGRAVRSQFHPRMLALLLIPFAVALAAGIAGALWWWDPLLQWLGQFFIDLNASGRAQWLFAWSGWEWVKVFLAPIVLLVVVVPATLVVALTLVSVLAMPVILSHLSRSYPDVDPRGSLVRTLAPSLANSISTVVMFVVGYLLTLPLWLIPGMAIILPLFWVSWLTARVLSFDALADHATEAERQMLRRERRGPFLMLGALVTLVGWIPFMIVLLPVFSALAFAHYGLESLRRTRAAEAALRPPGIVDQAA